MNTRQLIKIVSDITGDSEAVTKSVIDTAFIQIASALAQGDKVAIMGFGRFVRRDIGPRVGRNPVTGEVMTLPASRRIAFAPGKKLKDQM